jgi:hypothetical protein
MNGVILSHDSQFPILRMVPSFLLVYQPPF